MMAARWTGARRVVPAIVYVNPAECSEWLRERPGEPYPGRWEMGDPLDEAALAGIEADVRRVLSAAGIVGSNVYHQVESEGRDAVQDEDGGARVHQASDRGGLLVTDGGHQDRSSAPPLVAGAHCAHCNAAGACPALARQALTLLKEFNHEVEGQSDAVGMVSGRVARRSAVQRGATGDRDQSPVGGSPEDGTWRAKGQEAGGGCGAQAGRDESGVVDAVSCVAPEDSGRHPVLSERDAARFASMLGPARAVLGRVEDAVRGYVRMHGPIALPGGKVYGPASEDVERLDAAAVFGALEAAGATDPKVRPWEALRATKDGIREAVKGAKRGTFGRVLEAVRAAGGVDVEAREVWRVRQEKGDV